jgi:D-cysteine desulfhydrase
VSLLTKLSLSMGPTPLEHLSRMSVELGVDVWVKRDDLTGATLSGNKVRKLEYLLADAEHKGADIILTCGGDQSNHCRATTIAARQRGLDSMVFLRVIDPRNPPPLSSNSLLDRMVGATVNFISRGEYTRRREIMAAAAEVLVAEGRRPYIIPEGGSNALGSLGYVDCVGEIAEQIVDPQRPTTIVFAAGSGGTGAGLIAGVRSRKLPWRVVGVNVCDDRSYFVRAIGEIVEALVGEHGLWFEFDRESIEILEGFVGRGYALSRAEELIAMIALARKEGLVLDPVYTGKAWYGMVETLKADRRAFGDRIIFLHTGGIYGLFPKTDEIVPLL